MIKSISITILILLTLQACMPNQKEVKTPSFPDWVLTPAKDTSETIYGIGSGFSYNEAKEAALRDISGKLITEISSQSRSEVSLYNSSVSRSANTSINTRTIDTQLSDYKVVNSEQIGNEIFIQLSMSRSGFIKSTSSRLKELDDKIKHSLNNASKKTKLQQFIATQDLLPAIEKARSLVLLLQAAGSKLNADKHLNYYNDAINSSDDLLYGVRFNVSSNRSLHGFAKHLVTLLHNENISASMSKAGNADVYIHVSGDVKKSFLFSQHMAQLRAHIKISDNKNRVISVREYESSGSSVTDPDAASISAIKKMSSQFKDKGILNALGLLKNNN